MYSKKYFIRWSDLDANRHLAHSSYQKLTADSRLSWFNENGVNISEIIKKGIGSIIFYEQIYYFKEFLFGEEAYVTLKLTGLSRKCEFFKFEHCIYKKDGTHAYSSEILGSWINLKERKLCLPPKEIVSVLENLKEPNSQLLKKEDMRVDGIKPRNVSSFL